MYRWNEKTRKQKQIGEENREYQHVNCTLRWLSLIWNRNLTRHLTYIESDLQYLLWKWGNLSVNQFHKLQLSTNVDISVSTNINKLTKCNKLQSTQWRHTVTQDKVSLLKVHYLLPKIPAISNTIKCTTIPQTYTCQ